jgi:TolB-like protein/tetratricopeptide (TPR) repeat protein
VAKPFAPYDGDDAFVFVCYAHTDWDLVQPELVRLHSAGVNLWYDEGIRPGAEWSDEIADRIERCMTFLYFVTPRSVAAAYCRREVSFALERPRRMLAVHLERTDLPAGLRLLLNNLQAILCYDSSPPEYAPRLLRALAPEAEEEAPIAAAVEKVQRVRAVPRVPPARVAVAVIPFGLRNGGPDDQFLSGALADAVIHRLSSIGRLIVRPITTVLPYKDDAEWTRVARELNVEVVVHGVVLKQGSKVRVLSEVVRAADAETLHSAKHDGDLADLFGLQDRIADSISNVFAPPRSVAPEPAKAPTKNSRAYELYMRALDRMAHADRFDVEVATEMLRRAVELDPDFADAWGRLAEAYTQMGAHFDPDSKWFEHAEHAIARTLALDPIHCDALCARSMVLWSPSRGFQSRPALRAINASLRIDPNRELARSWRAAILFHLGFYEQAIRDLDSALLVDPGYVLAVTTRGHAAVYQGDYEAACDQYERALHLNPVHLLANLFSPAPLIYLGRLDEARQRIERARQILPEEPELIAMEGLIHARQGDLKKAETLADTAISRQHSMTHTHHTWHDAAGIYAICGRPDKAIVELRRCAVMGLPNYDLFQSDPHLRSLHGHADFGTLMSELRRSHDAFQEEFGYA